MMAGHAWGEHLIRRVKEVAGRSAAIAGAVGRRATPQSSPSFASCAAGGWGTSERPFRRVRRLTDVGWFLVLVLGLVTAAAARRHTELTVEELKARIAAANVPDRVHLCLEIAQKQLVETGKLYSAGEIEQGQSPLQDVVTYSELARDYSIQSHKHQKQTEIAVRAMTRKLNDLEHTLGQPDQPPIKNALDRLERVRDDLLASMFKKEEK